MKKLYTIALLLTITLTTQAQLNGTGYYRFRNAQYTDDYISMANNKFDYVVIIDGASGGFTNLAGDAGKERALACASRYMQTDIHMVKDADFIDPSTIIYANKKNLLNSDYDYDLIGQTVSLLALTTGTVSHPNSTFSPSITFSNLYANIRPSSGSGGETLYTAYIPLKGTLKYITTSTQTLGNRFFIDTEVEPRNLFDIAESSSTQNAKWYIEPVEHFNVQPEVEFGGKYYTTLYVPFAFQLSNNVLKAYAITAIGTNGVLEIEEITSNGGTVPAGTPVLLECASNHATECQLKPIGTPHTDNNSDYTDGMNLLKGAYFCNTDGDLTYPTASGTGTINANNYTAVTNSMYILGKKEDGKLKLVKATGTAMPANKAWLEYTGTAELVLPFEEPTKPGDVNRDGKVDVNDITAIVNIILGKDSAEPYTYDHEAAELDENTGISVGDLTVLVNIILKNNSSNQ